MNRRGILRAWAMLPVLLAGCGETPSRADLATDSLTDSVRVARRREFLLRQDSLTREHEARRQAFLRTEALRVEVVAFYPPTGPMDLDTLIQQSLVQPAKAVAAEAGWGFEQRGSGEIRVRDPDWQAQYAVRVPADSFGLCLTAPGHLPATFYGMSALDSLKARIQTRSGWPAGRTTRGGAPL